MKYSYINAVVLSFGGALSSFMGGRIVDRWEKSGQPCARLYIPILGTLLGLPCIALMLLAPSFPISIVGLCSEYLLAECWFAPVISVLQTALPPRVRGLGIACFTFTTAVSGSTAVYVLGLLMDKWTLGPDQGPRDLRILLLSTMCILYGICAMLFYCASRYLRNPQEATIEKQPLLIESHRRITKQTNHPYVYRPMGD
eukprot:FR742783.1.p1 GENE.FR742783.1~~FR742783.1.p1  ORF type:complete len:212 (+),score=11.64 FR742783.1:40-636(+)